jgi:hypothetical protein
MPYIILWPDEPAVQGRLVARRDSPHTIYIRRETHVRITQENIRQAKDRADEVTSALEAFNDAADTWLDYQEQRENGEKPDADEVKEAREELEGAIEEPEGLGYKVG